jgi:large conductance mechanosensitive channel
MFFRRNSRFSVGEARLFRTQDFAAVSVMGNVDFSSLAFTIKEASGEVPAVAIKYGVFINTVIDFVIVAFANFMVIKQMNWLKKTEVAAAPTTKDCPYCLMSVPIKATRCGHCTSELK